MLLYLHGGYKQHTIFSKEISSINNRKQCASRRRKSGYFGNGYVIDYYPQLQETNNEMKSHLALAMLGVPECEDDDFVYCR